MFEHKEQFEQLHGVCLTAKLAIQDQLQTIKESIYTYIYIYNRYKSQLGTTYHILYLTDLISRYVCYASIINYNHAARMPNPKKTSGP